jgi:SHS family lactate transporter-like MFS transporter
VVADPALARAWYRQVSRDQWRAFWAVFLGWVVDSFDFNILAFIVIDLQKSFTVDRALAGLLGTVTLVMRLVGGTLAGTAADKWGRKLPLIISVLWFSLFACLSGFSTSYAMLFAIRALFGLGMGGEWAAGMPLVLEHWPARLRGLASGLMLGGWYWGYLLSAAAFQFIYPLFSDTPDLAWRTMFWVCVIPALFTLWIRAKVPESPVWLERQRQLKASGGLAREPKLSLVRLFQPDLLKTTIQTTAVIGSFMCIYYSLNFWYPTVLRDAGRTNLLPFLAAFNVGAILGTATWGRLSEGRLGRRGAFTATLILGPASLPFFLLRRQHHVARHRRVDDGLLRDGRVGHGAGLHGRTISDRGQRCRPGLLLPRRIGGGRVHAVYPGCHAGPRHVGRQRHERGDGHVRGARRRRGVVGPRDPGPRLSHLTATVSPSTR